MTRCRPRVRLLLVASCIGVVASCSETGPESATPTETSGTPPVALAAGEIWQTVERFVPARTATRLPPTATVGSESRPVLRGAPAVTLNYAPEYRVPEDGVVRMNPPLPESVQGDSVFLSIRVKPGDRWIALPGRRVPSRLENGKLRVEVRFELPEAAGRRAGVWVQALAPLAREETREESAAFTVPPRARLDFAVAVLEPAWASGPVDFALDACSTYRAPEADGACEPLFRSRVDPSEPAGRGFLERSLGLQERAGRKIRLRFSAAPAGGADARSLPVFADPVLLAPGPRGKDERSLVLVSIDTLRADHLGSYGYARDTTPFVDALAAEGVLFEHYVAAASSTRPSHMTMFTSLQPSVHGATENTGVRTLPVSATTLAELLRGAGFATAAVTEDGAIDRSRGFGRGFGFYVENRDADQRRPAHRTRREDLRDRPRLAGVPSGSTLLPLPAHLPGPQPVHAARRLRPLLHRRSRSPGSAARSCARTGTRGSTTARSATRTTRCGRSWTRLKDLGVLENAYLVVTSDHGEAFLEHGFVAHGANVHREVVDVPLVVVGPDVPAGRRLANPVPMVDLMPTLLGLLGVAPTGAEMGRSQAALVRGEPEPPPEPRPIYSEAWAERAYRAHGFDLVPQPTLALQLGDRKLVRARTGKGGDDAFRYELYDLARDPLETEDLFARDPAAADDLIRLLRRYDMATKGLHDRLGAEDAAAPDAVDPDLQEKLRALGYLD